MPPRSIPASHFRTVARGRSPDQIDPSEFERPVAPVARQKQQLAPTPTSVKQSRTTSPQKRPGVMNKTETAWAQQLEFERAAGGNLGYQYEALKFRLAKRTTLTPDFLVLLPDGRYRIDEVKGGHVWEDAMVKAKVAASMFPGFQWRLVRRVKGQWIITDL